MTVYSYNAQQLKKKTGPRKEFWSTGKIAIAASLLSVVSFGALITTVPAPVITDTAVAAAPKVVDVTKTPEPYCSTYTNWKGEKVRECVEATPNWKETLNDYNRLQQATSQQASERRWQESAIETREAQCKAGTIHRQYC